MSSPNEQPTTSADASPQTPLQPLRLAHELLAGSQLSSPSQSFSSLSGSTGRPSWKSTMLSPSPSPDQSPVSDHIVLEQTSNRRLLSVDSLTSSPISSSSLSPVVLPADQTQPQHQHLSQPRLARQALAINKAADHLPTLPRPFGAKVDTALQLPLPHPHPRSLPGPTRGSLRSLSPDEEDEHEHERSSSTGKNGIVGSGYRSPPPLRLDTTSPIRELGPYGVGSPGGQRAAHSRSSSAGYQRPTPADEDHREPKPFALRSPPAPKSKLPALYRAQSHNAEYYPTPVSVTERPRWATPFAGDVRGREVRDMESRSHDARYRMTEGFAPSPTVTRPHHPEHVGHPHASYSMMRPRLHIHPYAPPMARAAETRYYSAGALPPRQSVPMAERAFSPASAISPGSFKAPRKRADDAQLSVLVEVFERTSYPTTEEREDLARRLGMTSRSVQIWNRRRAVKVEQQSAIQRAEAEARGMIGIAPAPSPASYHAPPLSAAMPGPRGVYGGLVQPRLPVPHGQYHGQMPPREAHHDGYGQLREVKREAPSPEREGRF